MKPSRILAASVAALVLLSVAGPAAAGPVPPEPTDPPETTSPPETTLPPETTSPPATSPPATTLPETTLPPDPTPESTQLAPEATLPFPHKPKPIASRDTGVPVRPGPKHILLIGNSIMNQVGPEVQAFMGNLNPSVPVTRQSVGQSSLFSKNQYRKGKTHVKTGDPGAGPTFNWLLRAQQLVASINPSVTVVEFGYNYKAPFPKDRNGVEIQPGTSAFVKMARKQAKALTNILRSRGGQVLFVSPLPLKNVGDQTIMNGSWAGFAQAQAKKHFGILWAGDALDGFNGNYTQRMEWCAGGNPRVVRDPDGLHLHEDNGVELMGEALMRGLAKLYGLNKPANTKFC